MKLEHHVNWSIYNYPSLYRSETYADSRLKVLNQLFFVIGNGLEWHPDGYLIDCFAPSNKQFRKTLPKGYFEKNLYSIYATPEQFPKIEKSLGKRLFYSINPCGGRRSRNERMVVFEAKDDMQAVKTFVRFDNSGSIDFNGLNENMKKQLVHLFASKAKTDHQNHPYPLSQYSALVELLEGKTNSMHQENFDLVAKPDWLQGCVDVAEDALLYFNDESRHNTDMHYPKKAINRMEYDLKVCKRGEKPFWWKDLKVLHKLTQNEIYSNGDRPRLIGSRWNCLCGWSSVKSNRTAEGAWQIEKERIAHEQQNKGKMVESIKEFATRTWENHRKHQINILNRFLKKFKKSNCEANA